MEDLLTKNAQEVLAAVRASQDHPTAQEIYDTVRQRRPQIGLATVYRILRQLAQHNLIKAWSYGNEGTRYDAHTERHDHAICTVCGRLIDVPGEMVLPETLLAEAARTTGLEIGSHEIRFYGRCQDCQIRDRA